MRYFVIYESLEDIIAGFSSLTDAFDYGIKVLGPVRMRVLTLRDLFTGENIPWRGV